MAVCTEEQRILAIPILGAVRLCCLIVDVLASAFYGTCSRGCGVAAYPGCEGLLGFTAVLNFFSVSALVIIVLVRWNTEERAYPEALVVTSALVLIDVLLKAGDVCTPIMLTAVCFPDSAIPPFNTSLSSQNCPKPCPVGDLYGIYAIYVLLKASSGIVDLLLNTSVLRRKPRDWYRLRGVHAR